MESKTSKTYTTQCKSTSLYFQAVNEDENYYSKEFNNINYDDNVSEAESDGSTEVQSSTMEGSISRSPIPNRVIEESESEYTSSSSDDNDEEEYRPIFETIDFESCPKTANEVDVEKYSTFCNFCTKRFQSENELIFHLESCMPSLRNIVNIPKRQCLICYRRIPSFTVCGIIKESISCLILERKKYWNKSEVFQNLEDNSRVEENKESAEVETDQVDEMNSDADAEDSEDDSSPPELTLEEPLGFPLQHCINLSPPHFPKVFSSKQREILLKFFQYKKFPSDSEKLALAEKTGLEVTQVKRWFERKRHSSRHSRGKLVTGTGQGHKPIQQKNFPREKTCKSVLKRQTIFFSDILWDSYRKCKFPDRNEKIRLMQVTGLSRKQIIDWFCNRRRKKNQGSTEGSKEENVQKTDPETTNLILHDLRSKYKKNRVASSIKGKPTGLRPQNCAEAQKLFETKYQANQNPTLKEIFDIVDETGMEVENLYTWFQKRRREPNDKSRRRRKFVRPFGKYRSQAKNSEGVRLLETVALAKGKKHIIELSNSEDEEKDKIELKDLPIRPKFAKIKKLNKDSLDSHISKSARTLSKLFTLYTGECKKILIEESDLMKIATDLIHPFTELQHNFIKKWETDLIASMLRSPSGYELIIHQNSKEIINIIEVWHPILVYSSILEISILEAVQELYRLSLARSEKAVEQEWMVPKLLCRVPEYPLPPEIVKKCR